LVAILFTTGDNDGAIEKYNIFHTISKAAAGYWGGEDKK
jgi:hypothetical protein